MPGTRSRVVSAALAKKLGLEAEPENSEDGEQLFHEKDDVVGHVEAPFWSRWMRHGLASTFLLRVELEGKLGFTSAFEQTEADLIEIQRLREVKRAKEEQEETVRKGDRLPRQAANDVRKHRHGTCTRRHVADVIERVARDILDQPRLSVTDVLQASKIGDDNDAVMAELFGMSKSEWLAAA